LQQSNAESPVESQLVSTSADRLASTILKVGHHGSYTSSSPAFLAAVHPQIAVYSAGGSNSYGHPHQVTLDNLAAAGATVYGTNVYGTIVVETDGLTYNVRTTLAEPLSPPLPALEASPVIVLTQLPENPASTPISNEQAVATYDPNGPDLDCNDFATHEDAQEYFIAASGPENNRDGLDGDSDGIACERLPHRPTEAMNATSQAAILTFGYDPFGRDRDCGSFQTHAEAQAFFLAAGGPEHDPHRLDGDDDGIACESLP
jgi:competence protein ComEC